MVTKRPCPYIFCLFLFVVFAITAFVIAPPAQVWAGFVRIVASRSLLVTDYFLIGGVGAALFNTALCGCFMVLVVKCTGAQPCGSTIMAVWMTAGFTFFGCNIFNIPPIILGVWLYAKLKRETFSEHAFLAMLATTLSPVVSEFAFLGRLPLWAGIAVGWALGIAAGFIMPVLAAATMQVHKGYNLYNVGFAGGVVAVFISAFCHLAGIPLVRSNLHSAGNNLFLAVFLYANMLFWVLLGLFLPPRQNRLANLKELLRHPGLLKTNFYVLYDNTAYLNMGISGALATTIVLLMGAQLTAAAVAGIFAIMGFGCFGKHPVNMVPVMAGATLLCAVANPPFNSPGNICTILFSTGLAPVAGQFGWVWGIVAGIIHAALVNHVGQIAGGLNLYNNGFAAGLVALVLVPIILFVRKQAGKPLPQSSGQT